MADIIELIRADHLHIALWQAELADLGPGSGPGHRKALAAAWTTLASLIDLHVTALDEVCFLPGATARDLRRAREAFDVHEDIREIFRETRLQPPGSPLWWHLATSALSSAWSRELARQERGILARLRRADPARRERLGHQWRAFMEARIRDQVPHDEPQVAACRLRRAHPGDGIPLIAAATFDPIYCTCQACDDLLDRFFRRRAPARRPARFLRALVPGG
jgi:hypothetical protein